MTEREAVLLFKRDCFDEKSWKRICKRYKDKSCELLVKHIIKTYDVKNKKNIENELRIEFSSVT